jgi:hypothetical protein
MGAKEAGKTAGAAALEDPGAKCNSYRDPFWSTRRAGVAESERAPAISGTPDFQRADSGDTKAVGSALHHHGIRCSDGSRRRDS